MNLNLLTVCIVIMGTTYCVRDGMAKIARTVFLSDKKTAEVYLVPGRTTILNFPSRPLKVILGNQGLFAVEYVESDLAVSPLRASAKSNLFVYLEGRRFGFDLKTVSQGGDEIIVIRDAADQKVRMRIKDE